MSQQHHTEGVVQVQVQPQPCSPRDTLEIVNTMGADCVLQFDVLLARMHYQDHVTAATMSAQRARAMDVPTKEHSSSIDDHVALRTIGRFGRELDKLKATTYPVIQSA
jgi:peptide subunit release factor RF-3